MKEEQESAERAAARLLYEKKCFDADPWWAIENGYVWTEDEHAPAGTDARRQFPQKQYLNKLVRIYQAADVGIVMKARQLMLSWLFCWLLLHEAVSRAGALCVAQGKREEDVLAKGTKALMGRIRFMRKNLPPHLAPRLLEDESKGTEVYEHDGGKSSTILAVPQGEDIVRSLTASRILMDELAFHPEGERAWTAALPTIRGGGKLWGITTPNGREFCHQQADERLPWEEWEKWPKAMEGLHGYQNAAGVQLIALHYTADEDKRGLEYQQELRKGYTKVQFFRQENELDFSMQPGEGVYINEYNDSVHLLKVPYRVNSAAPIYRGWDFGYNGQACSFFQFNNRGQLVWFDQVFAKRVPLQSVVHEVLRRTIIHSGKKPSDDMKEFIDRPLLDLEGNVIEAARYSERRMQAGTLLVFDFCDPSAEAKNTKGESDRMTLQSFGIELRTRPTTNRKRDLVEQVRSLLLPRSDGSPAMLIAEGPSLEMRYVREGMKGGYHYPEQRLQRADKMLPEKDGFYDHIFDSAQYAVDHIRPIRASMAEDYVAEGNGWQAPEWTDNALAGMVGDDGDVHIH